MLRSEKFKHSDDGFNGYKEDDIVMLTSNEWIHKIFSKRWKKHVFYD